MSQHSIEDANAHTQSVPALQRKRKARAVYAVERTLTMAMIVVGVVFLACMVGLVIYAVLTKVTGTCG